MGQFQRRRRLFHVGKGLLLSSACLVSSVDARAQTQAYWLDPIDGNWTTAANWSVDPAIPFNGFPNTLDRYIAWIDAVASPYTVTMDFGIDVEGVVLDSNDATLHHTAGMLDLNGGTLDLRAGTYLYDGGTLGNAEVTSTGGSFVFGAGNATLSGVTFNQTDLNIVAGQVISGSNTLQVNGGAVQLGSGGNRAYLMGFGTINFDANADILLDGAEVFASNRLEIFSGSVIRGVAGTNNRIESGSQVHNRGSILVEGAGADWGVEAIVFTNHATGLFRIDDGAHVYAGATDIFLNYGTLDIGAGGDFTASNFINTGTLTAGAGARLRLTPHYGLASDLGTIDAVGAQVLVEGGMDLEGGSFDLGGAAWYFGDRFNVTRNGTITAINGGTVAGGYLEDIVLDTDMFLSGGSVTAESGIEVTQGHAIVLHRAVADGSSSSSILTTAALMGQGELRFESDGFLNGTPSRLIGFEDTLYIDSGFTVRAVSATGLIYTTHVENHGLIEAQDGSRIRQDLGSITNDGTLRATTGGVLELTSIANHGLLETNSFGAIYLDGDWTNDGTILIDTGTLRLGGAFDPTMLNGLTVNSGQVRIIGDLDATTDPLIIDGNSDGLWLIGGLVSENGEARLTGNLQTVNGGRLYTTSNTVFKNLALDGRIDAIDANRIRFEGDTTLLNGAELHFLPGNSTTIRFAETQSVLGDGALVFDTPENVAQISLFNTGVLTLGSGVTLRTGLGSGRVYSGTLINEGTIRAEGEGQYIDLSVTLHNAGTIEAIHGGVIQIETADYTQTGSLLNDTGVLRFDGDNLLSGLPTYTVQNQGVIQIAGDLDLEGQAWSTDGPRGGLVLLGGSAIINGVVDASGGTPFVVGPGTTEIEADVLGELWIQDGATTYFSPALPLDGLLIRVTSELGSTRLILETPDALSGDAEVRFEGQGDQGRIFHTATSTLTIGAGIDIRALGGDIQIGSGSRLSVLHGSIFAEAPGYVVGLSSSGIGTNHGLIETQAGAAIAFYGQWANAGTIRLAVSESSTMATEHFVLLEASELVVAWDPDQPNGSPPVIQVNGTLTLGGTLTLASADEHTVGRGSRLVLFDADQTVGAFNNITLDGVEQDDLFFLTEGRLTTAYFAFLGDATLDGLVDVEDLDLILTRWGDDVTPGDWAAGDLTGDGTIGQADLQLVLDHWGTGSTPETNIPEPGTLALLVMTGLAMTRRRRHIARV